MTRVFFFLLLVGSAAFAQNFDHPGLVHAAKHGWVAPEKAVELGYFEYRGRWYPKKFSAKLRKWERLDGRVKGWKDAYKAKSKHYRIVTDVPRFILELEIKPFLDQLYATYVEVFKKDFGLAGKAANQKTIRIFYGFENFSRNAEDDGSTVARVTTGFITGDSVLNVYYEDHDPGEFYGTTFHEGAHQFIMALLPGASLPVWLDEALATYFEGCTYSRATKKITVGYFPADRVSHAKEVLEKSKPIPGLSQPEKLFMNVSADDFEPKEYALSWSFVYYLTHVDGGRHRKAFTKFLRATNGAGTRPMAEIFQRTTKMKLRDLEEGWRDYVLALKAPPEVERISIRVGGETDARVDLKTGDLIGTIGGVEISSFQDFERVWTKRARRDVAVKWVVLRRSEKSGPLEYVETVVHTVVPSDTTLVLEDDEALYRSQNLRD